MKLKYVVFLALGLVLVAYPNLTAQEPQSSEVQEQTENSKSDYESKVQSPKASIEDIKWISGHWTGKAMGGSFEETWNPPAAGSMMGMFKFYNGDQVGFYEILTIVPTDESLMLRLKHFNNELIGWEEKDKTVDFPLLSVKPDEVKFNGLTFKKISDDEMHILVVIDQGSEAKTVNFKCKRTPLK